MDWEVYNNRRPPEPPTWLDWTPIEPMRYLGSWLLYVWLIPYLFGMVLTPFGILITTVALDYFQYIRARSLGHY